MSEQTYLLDLGITLLAGASGAAASFAVIRHRVKRLEETFSLTSRRVSLQIKSLEESRSVSGRHLVELQKDDLTLEKRLLGELRTMEKQANQRYVNAREFSVVIADLRRHIERLEQKEL